VKLTVPPGFEAPAPAVSVAVTITVVACPTTSGLVPKDTLVEVDRAVTVRLALPLLLE
jgi:hypothetical protein